MQILESKQGEALILALQGHLDEDSAWSVEKRLDSAIKHGALQIVLDCAALDYINSSGLKAILVSHNLLGEKGGRLAVAGLASNVSAVFEMVGFDRILTICPDVAQATRTLEADGTTA